MPRKSKVVENASSQKTQELTTEEVWDVLKFAQAAYNGLMNGVYTPDLVNARLKDVTLSPIQATSDKINSALNSPKENEQNLIGYSEWLELTSMLYKRVLLYFSGLMSFDMNYVCTNADKKDYKSKAYEKDLAIVRDFFDRFNIKKEFKTALRQMLRQEAFYSVLRDDYDKYVLQELPQQYCKIVGRYQYGLLFDFNFQWFLNPTVSIDMYPNVFRKMYMDIFDENGRPKNYNPASQLDMRTGTFVLWHQTSPDDGFCVFKFTPEIGSVIPFLSPLMPDVVMQPVMRELQKNSYIQAASKIIFGQVEFLKDTTSKVKDALTLSPDTLGKFLALLKAGIPDVIKVAAAPLANATAIEFQGDDKIYNSYLQTTAASSGVNSRLLYSFDRQNILETKLSIDIDENVLRPLYSQFEDMLEFWVNRRTKKFKFKFMLEGFETTLDRDARLEKASKLGEQGIVLDQKYASAMGMNPFDFRRMLEETKANEFVGNLTPIMKSSQMPGKAAGAGRPASADDKLGDSGAQTRGDGSNDEKGEE